MALGVFTPGHTSFTPSLAMVLSAQALDTTTTDSEASSQAAWEGSSEGLALSSDPVSALDGEADGEGGEGGGE